MQNGDSKMTFLVFGPPPPEPAAAPGVVPPIQLGAAKSAAVKRKLAEDGGFTQSSTPGALATIKRKYGDDGSVAEEWVQCHACSKWRKLPAHRPPWNETQTFHCLGVQMFCPTRQAKGAPKQPRK